MCCVVLALAGLSSVLGLMLAGGAGGICWPEVKDVQRPFVRRGSQPSVTRGEGEPVDNGVVHPASELGYLVQRLEIEDADQSTLHTGGGEKRPVR